MSAKILLAPGAPCSCHPERSVRFVVPPVPGVPYGEVSCRTAGGHQWADVRHHEIPKNAGVAACIPPGPYHVDIDDD